MANLIYTNPAPDGPGNPLNWSRADKDAIGTARSLSSLVWYTIAGGVITEIYYPDIDSPQVKDLQLIITDGKVFYDATRDFTFKVTPVVDFTIQAIRITLTAKDNRLAIVQDVIAEPGSSCVLVKTTLQTLQGDQAFLDSLHVYVLLAPHMGGYGSGNYGFVANTSTGQQLVATRSNYWLSLGCDCGFKMTSCGFVGKNDGWTDIIGNRRLPIYNYRCAYDGNIALTGEIDRKKGKNEFVMAVAFCYDVPTNQTISTPNVALSSVLEALAYPFDGPPGTYNHLQEFVKGWNKVNFEFKPTKGITYDNDSLFNVSRCVLLSHEDKLANGALVASLSIPWGQQVADLECGYHLVWPRDMCHSATALIAAGEYDLPLRGLMFLANSQSADGSFHQKFFIDGQPWPGECIQLDEYSFPILLAYHLYKEGKLKEFEPKQMILSAAGAIIRNGPMTQQERWEEIEGYSPSTLAANIAALVCAADMAKNKWNDHATADFLLDYADFLESHIEKWCVSSGLLSNNRKHYIRILPTHVKGGGSDYSFPENPDTAEVYIWGNSYPANKIVDGGFLELVRYGIRAANDPFILNSIEVIEKHITTDVKGAPAYFRYNHDHYGQGVNGEDWFNGCDWGVGHPWPLLTGERGHYELAAGGNAKSYIAYMEQFAGASGLIPEQVWELENLDGTPWLKGGPTGSARPLAWAHAEYIKLVRSVSDGKVFDMLDIAVKRYQSQHQPSNIEVWNFDRRLPSMEAGKTVRFPLAAPFRLHWTADGATWQDLVAAGTAVGIYYADLPTSANQKGSSLSFNFYWLNSQVWQQPSNFSIKLF